MEITCFMLSIYEKVRDIRLLVFIYNFYYNLNENERLGFDLIFLKIAQNCVAFSYHI